MIWVWLLLLPIAVMAQDFEALNEACYEEPKLLICSKHYADFFNACEENTDLSHLSFHRPTHSICVKMHMELCISGDFCIQAEMEAPRLNISELNQKLYKNPESKPYDRTELEDLQEDPNIQFKISTDDDQSREVRQSFCYFTRAHEAP